MLFLLEQIVEVRNCNITQFIMTKNLSSIILSEGFFPCTSNYMEIFGANIFFLHLSTRTFLLSGANSLTLSNLATIYVLFD